VLTVRGRSHEITMYTRYICTRGTKGDVHVTVSVYSYNDDHGEMTCGRQCNGNFGVMTSNLM